MDGIAGNPDMMGGSSSSTSTPSITPTTPTPTLTLTPLTSPINKLTLYPSQLFLIGFTVIFFGPYLLCLFKYHLSRYLCSSSSSYSSSKQQNTTSSRSHSPYQSDSIPLPLTKSPSRHRNLSSRDDSTITLEEIDTEKLLDANNGRKSHDLSSPSQLPPSSPFPSFLRPIYENTKFMKSIAVILVVLLFVYLADIRQIFTKIDRSYSRDFFTFLCIVILLAAYFTKQVNSDPVRGDSFLSRDITDEWKGWMQIIFLLYHYFAAKETYNLIRVLIAGYVWLTGFGNFTYFYKRKDYSIHRLIRMLFRLNFFVVLIMMATGNEYMLYYICPMHTYWFLSVYAMMVIKPEWNYDTKLIWVKFGAYAVVNFVLFEGEAGSYFFQLMPFLNYQGELKEWMFRAGLDRWGCLLGMIFAYFYNTLDTLVRGEKGQGIKSLLTIGFIGITIVWGKTTLIALDKFTYNASHAYFSIIPIMSYIVVRNCSEKLRRTTLHMFRWCGRITLETYLLQFHAWLLDDAKSILVYPGFTDEYRLLNFLFSTGVYILASDQVFYATNIIGDVLFTSKMSKVGLGVVGFGCALLWAVAAVVANSAN